MKCFYHPEIEAKSAFVINDGVWFKVFDKLYGELAKWNRFRRECSVFPQRLSHSLIGQQSHQSMWPQLTADFESHAEAIADRGDGS